MNQVVAINRASQVVGRYSHAIKMDGFVFLSGQIPLDRVSGQIIAGGIIAQTEQLFTNIAAVLDAAGTTMGYVAEATVFLKNMSDVAVMNELYHRFSKSEPPARSKVDVARLPKDVLVEIEVIALA
jgi:2-iminobutanoate/2-iminopropanoate deaminase